MAANGVQENRLAQARQLIAEKNYNDAILILAAVVKEEPDRQDEVQEIINEVMALKNQYNSDYEKVLDLLYVKDNVDEALALISQIEALDKNPNKQMAEDLRQMKRGAQIKSFNKAYNDIMARALALLDRREYAAAVQVYLEGSNLGRSMFNDEAYGNVLTDQVDRAWSDLRAASALFVQAEPRLKTLPDQGMALLASASTAPVEPVLAAMRDLAAWRQRVWTDGALFRSQNQFLVKNGRQEDIYLGYSSLFVHGPADSARPEGILGAVDRLWAEALDPWTVRIRTEVETLYTQAKAALDQGRYAAAKTSFETLRLKSRQGLDVVTLWNRVAGFDASGTLSPVYRAKLAQVLPLGLWLEHRLALAGDGIQASTDLPRAAALAAAKDLDRAALEAARAELRAQKGTFASYSAAAGQWIRQSQALAAQGFALLDPPAFGTLWQTGWAAFRQAALQQEAVLVDRRGTFDYQALDGRFQTLQSQLASAREQVEGATPFPLQAAARLNEVKPPQDLLAQDIGGFVALYDGESADVKTPAVAQWPVRGRDLLARLATAQTLRGQLLATAQTNYARSQTLKRQGQDLVALVTTATTAENFVKARADLNTVSARFSESLKLQEDAAFRAESDAQVKALFSAILKAENEVVVRDVRKLITQGSEAYLAQLFRPSEQILLRAQKRWADTNQELNPEVEYWLQLTSYALSVTTGRELSPIDPLYNEVQQMLNFSRRDYTLGKDKIAAGDKAAGLALMNQANATLGQILLTAPQNQEAGILKLEILKASDPDNFPALFKQNFDAAVAKIAAGDPQVAYANLQDLDKIQPGYPGMAAAIKEVRIKLNLEAAPVDVKALAQSRTLVAQATRLFAGGSPVQLDQALVLVRAALKADPKNGDAQDLIDKISLKRTVFVATLTPSQIGELNDMIDLVLNQRQLEALARINDFKARNPGLANEVRVKETERRIRAANQ